MAGIQSRKARVISETTAGQATDTARYLAAGARRALLVTRCGPEIPIDEIRAALKADRNILFESNRIIDVVKPDVCLALVGGSQTESKPSFVKLLHNADAVLSVGMLEMEIRRDWLRGFHVLNCNRSIASLRSWRRGFGRGSVHLVGRIRRADLLAGFVRGEGLGFERSVTLLRRAFAPCPRPRRVPSYRPRRGPRPLQRA